MFLRTEWSKYCLRFIQSCRTWRGAEVSEPKNAACRRCASGISSCMRRGHLKPEVFGNAGDRMREAPLAFWLHDFLGSPLHRSAFPCGMAQILKNPRAELRSSSVRRSFPASAGRTCAMSACLRLTPHRPRWSATAWGAVACRRATALTLAGFLPNRKSLGVVRSGSQAGFRRADRDTSCRAVVRSAQPSQ